MNLVNLYLFAAKFVLFSHKIFLFPFRKLHVALDRVQKTL